MNKASIFWNKLSSHYDKQVNCKYSQAYNLTIEKTKKYLKNTDSVLDYACGTGITIVKLANNVKEIKAIDISIDMINIAKKKIKAQNINNVSFQTCDIMNGTIKDNSFDAVLAFNILYFVENIDEVLEKVWQTLKDGGLFISVTDCLGEKKSIVNLLQSFFSKLGIIPYIRRYTIKELEDVIKKADFSIIETDNLYTNPPNYFIVGKKN